MSPQSKKEYLEAIYLRYKQASYKARTSLLNEFCTICGYHRKHAIRLLNTFKRFTKPTQRKRGKPSRYNNPEILTPLKRIWHAANLPCSKRLKAIMPLWLPSYHLEFTKLSTQVRDTLLSISPATIDRLFKPIRSKYSQRGRSTTKPGTLLRKQIPIKTNQWNETVPGFLESDTVAHCGVSTAGMFAFSLDMLDIASGWTIQRAVWGKGETGVLSQIQKIERILPFPIKGFDADNGGEFLNYHLIRYFVNRKHPVQFTRSRAYKKDDNAHIEQKNWTHVRQWLGYERFDNPAVIDLMNALYSSEWYLYHNFFCPSVKLIDKKRIKSKIIKLHDSPKTPYQRLLDSPHISDNTKENLRKTFAPLNPFQLRKAIERKIKAIFATIHKRVPKKYSF